MKKIIKGLLARSGFDVRRKSRVSPRDINVFFDPRLEPLYRETPFVFIDIGASGGIKAEWKIFEKHRKVIAFEPDPSAYDQLLSHPEPNVTYIKSLLYNDRVPVTLNVTRGGGQSSIYQPNREFLDKFSHLPKERMDIVNKVTFDADKLDSILDARKIVDVDFMKLDTQGSERLILEGSSEILKKSVFGLEIEVEFAEHYREQPMFADVDQFMRGLGFYLFDIRRCYWKRNFVNANRGFKGQLSWGEALYLKRPENIPAQKAKYLKALSICNFYGYLDYALEILELAQKGRIWEDEYPILLDALVASSRKFRVISEQDDLQIGNAPPRV